MLFKFLTKQWLTKLDAQSMTEIALVYYLQYSAFIPMLTAPKQLPTYY